MAALTNTTDTNDVPLDHIGITPERRIRLIYDGEIHRVVLLNLYLVIVDIEDTVPHIWRKCLH